MIRRAATPRARVAQDDDTPPSSARVPTGETPPALTAVEPVDEAAETAAAPPADPAPVEPAGDAAASDAADASAAEAPRPASDPPPSTDPPVSTLRSSAIPPPRPSARERSLLADPTQRPPSDAPPSVDLPPATRSQPLLASEALMEDLAPVEPARRDARIWCVGSGVAFLLFGMLPLLGLLSGGLGAAVPWLVTGAISLVAGVARVAYRQRAVAMLVLGLLTGLVALQGSGILVVADGGAGWGVARLFAVVALTAALLFRARYRAYAGARVFLGTALVISVPFVVHAAAVLAGDAGFGPAHVGAIVVLLAIAATLMGFMGAETTGAGPYLAPILVMTFAGELASRGVAVVGLSGGLSPLLSVLVGAAGFGAAAGFTGLGLFQILAWRFAADARRINLHSPPREPVQKSEHDPSSEWSTRE